MPSDDRIAEGGSDLSFRPPGFRCERDTRERDLQESAPRRDCDEWGQKNRQEEKPGKV